MLIKKVGMVLAAVLLSGAALAAQLTPEQQAAKEKGITLYNQYKDAEPYLRIAAKAGDRESQYYLGEELRHASRFMTEEAQKWYTAAAEQGDYYAMFRLATAGSDLCAAMGSCPKGNKAPGEWLKQLWATAEPLANDGDAEAMMIMYNAKADLEWLEKSADAGYAPAQWLLANRYLEGRGFFFPPWNRSKKVEELLKKSAEGGFAKGMGQYMGILHKGGDLEGARFWLEKTAAQGSQAAVGSYGAYLAHTPDQLGYPLDLVKGYGLVSLLQELDGGGGVEEYVEDKLTKIAAKMTPEQIEEAKSFAEQWKASHPPLSFFPDKLGF